jgi:hypothetical protein
MSYSPLAELSRHGSTDWPSRKIAAWHVPNPPLFALHRSQAPRPGRALRRRGVRGPLPTTAVQLARRPKKAKPPSTEAKRRGQAERSGESSGISPDCDSPTRTHAEDGQAERSGQAECSGEEVRGPPPGYETTQHAHAQKKAKRCGQAEQGSGGSPGYDKPTCTHAEEGQATRSGHAERSGKGGTGAHPSNYDTTQHAHAKNKAKRCGEAEARGGLGGP